MYGSGWRCQAWWEFQSLAFCAAVPCKVVGGLAVEALVSSCDKVPATVGSPAVELILLWSGISNFDDMCICIQPLRTISQSSVVSQQHKKGRAGHEQEVVMVLAINRSQWKECHDVGFLFMFPPST